MLTVLIAAWTTGCAGPEELEQAWVRVPDATSAERLRALPVGFAEGRVGDRVRVIGTPAQLAQVQASGLELTPLGPPAPLPASYPSVQSIEDRIDGWTGSWPDRAHLAQLGTSVEGRPLWGVRLGATEAPVLRRIVSGVHGDEGSAVALGLALGDALLEEAPGFEGLLDDAALWLVPLANPDGYDAGARFNRNNVDLNRNFSYGWSASEYAPGTAPFSEPESQALRTLSLGLGAPVGLALHSGATNLGYVWNHTTQDTVEEDRLVALGQVYVDACAQEGFYLTNGAEWYTTRGDLNDWSYGEQGTLDYTVEVSAAKSPEGGSLDDALAHHLAALATWLDEPVRLQGQLRSAESGEGLEGWLTIEDSTDAFVTDPQGHFARVLESGSWTVTAQAPGHATLSVTTSLDAPLDLTLEPAELVALRPEPVRLSQVVGSTVLMLDGIAPPDRLTLSRPGVDSLNLAFDGIGYPVNPAVLVPGPYTLSGDDWVAPRAVFAGAHDGLVVVSDVALEEDCVVLTGEGFAPGTQAWALWGTDRPLIPIDTLSLSDEALVLDRGGLPTSGTVDLLLVSQGREVAVVDVLGDPELDTAPIPDSGGPIDTGGLGQRLAGRCAALPVGPPGAAVLAWLLLLLRRSRRPW